MTDLNSEWITTTIVLKGLAESENSQAWSSFAGYFRPVLVGFGRNAGLGPDDAEDFAQQVMLEFVKAYQAGKYVRQKGRLRHWLFGIARNVLAQRFRAQGRVRRCESNGQALQDLADPHAAEHLWQQQWQKMALQICLDRARREFDKKTFAAFDMYALQEHEPRQVGEELGLSRNAVYIAKSRVLSRIRELIEQFDE